MSRFVKIENSEDGVWTLQWSDLNRALFLDVKDVMSFIDKLYESKKICDEEHAAIMKRLIAVAL